jgi:hypothetical protein
MQQRGSEHCAVLQQTSTTARAASAELLSCCGWLACAGDVYEQAVMVSLKSQNEDMQESAFTQLKTFYDDTR